MLIVRFLKPEKRDIEHSENLFRRLEEEYRLNSYEGEIKMINYLRINNTDISPESVAQMIKKSFFIINITNY